MGRFTTRTRLRTVVSASFGLALLVLVVFRQVDFEQTLRSVAQLDPLNLVAAAVLLVVAYAVRSARWLTWDRCLGFRDSARAVLIGFMGNNLLPARLGEVLRADWIASLPQQVHFGRTAALASIAVERVLDGAFLSLLGVLGLVLINVNEAVLKTILMIAGLFGVLAALLIVGVAREAPTRRFIDRTNSFFPAHVTRYARAKLHFALDGIVRLRGAARVSGALLATGAVWLLELACYWTIAESISPLSLPVTAILLTVTNFASLFPGTIGGIGAIEGAGTAFLVSVGVPAEPALAIVLIHHGIQFLFTTITGGVVYLTAKPSSPSAEPEAGPEPADNVLGKTDTLLARLKADIRVEAPDTTAILLSIVIPAYNERLRLPRTALEAIRWCHTSRLSYEIIIVDDGSSDDTLSIAELLGHHDKNIRTIACPHRGKGNAVRMGMLNARGAYVLFMDADGATPLSEIPRLVAALEAGHDVAIGSRVLQEPGEVVVETSLHRKLIGRVFAFCVNVLAVPGIADSQCGFKMFRREVVKAIFTKQKLEGFAFDVELLYIARQLDLPVAEVPVNWQNQEGSKVNLVVDSTKMLWDLSRIRWIHRNTIVHPRAASTRPAAEARRATAASAR